MIKLKTGAATNNDRPIYIRGYTLILNKYIVSSSEQPCNQNSCSLMAVIFILKIQKEMIFYGISKRQKPQ